VPTFWILSSFAVKEPLKKIREEQERTWEASSPGWKKWNGWVVPSLQPMTQAVLAALGIKEDDVVLDVAAGTGEPGISIALLARKGRVVATDLSEGMLAAARGFARERGAYNY